MQENTWSDVDVLCAWMFCAPPSQNMYVRIDGYLVNSLGKPWCERVIVVIEAIILKKQ